MCTGAWLHAWSWMKKKGLHAGGARSNSLLVGKGRTEESQRFLVGRRCVAEADSGRL